MNMSTIISTSEAVGIAAACFIGMIASLILAAWREMLHRGELIALREYVLSLRRDSILRHDQMLDATLDYIAIMLGERDE